MYPRHPVVVGHPKPGNEKQSQMDQTQSPANETELLRCKTLKEIPCKGHVSRTRAGECHQIDIIARSPPKDRRQRNAHQEDHPVKHRQPLQRPGGDCCSLIDPEHEHNGRGNEREQLEKVPPSEDRRGDQPHIEKCQITKKNNIISITPAGENRIQIASQGPHQNDRYAPLADREKNGNERDQRTFHRRKDVFSITKHLRIKVEGPQSSKGGSVPGKNTEADRRLCKEDQTMAVEPKTESHHRETCQMHAQHFEPVGDRKVFPSPGDKKGDGDQHRQGTRPGEPPASHDFLQRCKILRKGIPPGSRWVTRRLARYARSFHRILRRRDWRTQIRQLWQFFNSRGMHEWYRIERR